MTRTTAGHTHTEIRELEAQISELENQYAELFLDISNLEQLKTIHMHLETLKQELKQKLRRTR